VRHRLDGVRRRAGRGADADVVERNDPPLRSQRVHERWIPVVEVPAEVLEHDERYITTAKVAVRILDPVLGSDSLRRRVGVAGQWVAGRVVRWSP
jgi:hypothetical protein